MMTHDVFISYSVNDKPVADVICTSLESNSIHCWIAPRDILPGSTWGEAIVNAIRTSKVMVLVLSAQSNESTQVLREVERAVSKNVIIIPFRVEDVLPSPALEYYISSEHWLDAFTPPLEAHLQRLVEALAVLLVKKEEAFITAPKKHDLPVQLTSFIGREKEIAQVEELFREHRLVTLTGVGGTGKTRLALQVGTHVLDNYPDGVWLVELAPLADPSLVPQTVIAALGLVEQSGKTPIGFLEDYLRSKHLLLILDNCEHLIEACASLASLLLQNAPRLAILASSREILGVDGEIPFRVPPLEIPDPRRLPPLEELAQFEAVRLFVERAGVVSPGFTLTADNAAAVAQITQRLDGIPLAIELAAARLRLLSVGQIALRLNDAFRLLTGGSRAALPRHQTLQALIDWSYNLLSEEERSLLRSLSVFAGGWTLEAAEEVCAGEGVAAQDILDLLGQLADKSLIMAVPATGGEMRYRMLETVRQYAHTRLVEAGEAEAVRTRHLAYYLRLAERLEPRLRGREQIPILDYWEGELDNLRLALEWALQTDIEAELRLAAALYWFWHIRFHWAEAIAWLEQGLAVEALVRGDSPLTGSRAVIRAKTLSALGFHMFFRDRYASDKATPILEEAVALYRASELRNRRGLAWALVRLGSCKVNNGETVQAHVLAEEALSLFRECEDHHGMAESLLVLGQCEIDLERSKKVFQDALAIDEANGDTDGIATDFFFIGLSLFDDGDYVGAYTAFESSNEHYRRVGNPDAIARGSVLLAHAALLNGDLERATRHLEEALADFREMVNDAKIADCLCWEVIFDLVQGHYDQIPELIEEIWRIWQKIGDLGIFNYVYYYRAHLARLLGDAGEARRCAEEGLKAGRESPNSVWLLLELGYLALEEGDLLQARAVCRESLQQFISRKDLSILDFLAVLAMRQGEMERAARLFGTRQWRAMVHLLSPIERAGRDADFATITTALGAERFAQLREEGAAMTTMQVLALAQEEN